MASGNSIVSRVHKDAASATLQPLPAVATLLEAMINHTNASAAPSDLFNLTHGPEEEEDKMLLVHLVSIIVPVIFGIIVLVGLFGNALVVVVVAANQTMRSTTNLLIINLAVADLLFIVFCVPFTATDYALPYWPFGDAWCKIVQYLIVVTALASVYTLVLMSLDRFLAVVHPVASMSVRTQRNAMAAIGVTWVVILAASFPVILFHGEVTHTYGEEEDGGPSEESQGTSCVFLQREEHRPDGYNRLAFQVSFFATSYVLPLALICGLYVCMLARLWRGAAPGGHVSAESRRGRKRVTRMVVVVVAIFAVCWCPIQVILVLKSVDHYEITNVSVFIQIASQVLAYLNSCVNPILYAFLSENFRKAFRKVIYCGPAGGMLGANGGTSRRRTQNGRCDYERTKTTRSNGSNDIL
ncbi:allatostatin-A receptor-like [Ischnura elegans]|uniref:allatostatin-A receptor-like n=1 Tax=Ischnura elegans TaxID=197161 RepID=UPI001ED89309|nr:allatostatin-A receptor-like [Ischnura elegans]